MTTQTAEDPKSRLQRLLGFLDVDPHNERLLADTATAAFDAGELETANQLIGRFNSLGTDDPAMRNLGALVALRTGRHDEAAETFETLLADMPTDAVLRFNLAWAKALIGDHEAVVTLVDEDVVASAPRAAALKVEALHHLDRLEEAITVGQTYAVIVPADADLAAAIATVAMDNDDLELAERFAARAGGSPVGLAAQGALALGAHDPSAAIGLFDRALDRRATLPRAQVGKGLALLSLDRPADAARWLDQGAAAFEDHLGSWIAAGWAHFIAGDAKTARARFDHALLLDETFAESHGALAVLDMTEGQAELARKRADIALRLDRTCLSAALAKSMLAAHAGDPDAATAIRNKALNHPAGPGGETLADAIARMGLRRR
ncbi:tetratricopeptide repeat protein [Sphingomonas sanxanigenens]|nr:tetratricopeptide repeat protein [Sphingomonas sanxanigenens]